VVVNVIRVGKGGRGGRKGGKDGGIGASNGRSATVVVMYTLRRGEEGKLDGPINKKVWG